MLGNAVLGSLVNTTPKSVSPGSDGNQSASSSGKEKTSVLIGSRDKGRIRAERAAKGQSAATTIDFGAPS